MAPFLNLTKETSKQNFRGGWQADKSIAEFQKNYGTAEMTFFAKSYKYSKIDAK